MLSICSLSQIPYSDGLQCCVASLLEKTEHIAALVILYLSSDQLTDL